MINQNLWLGLANNTAWLLTLFIAYEISYNVGGKRNVLRHLVSGLYVSGVCAAIMFFPFQLYPGIVFDTRSILISITALTIGIIPTCITVFAAVFYRVIIGGVGTFAGIATILASAIIGLAWRKWIYPIHKIWKWINIYFMSLAVHFAMLLCQLLLPNPNNLFVIRTIALPVLLIYPVASVLLSMLLIHQQERRQYQENLELSEKKYRRITENISDIVWTMDINMNTTYVSQSVEKLLGEPPCQHMKRSIEEKFPPESLKKVKALFLEELTIEKDPNCKKDRTRVIELEHYKVDGTSIWLSMHISFLRDSAGRAIGFQGVSRDISERKKSELALDQERKKAQLYLDIAPVIFVALDPDMKVTLINQQGCNTLGVPRNEIIGINWIDRFIPDAHKSELKKNIQDILAGDINRYKIFENPVITEKNTERMVSWHNTVLKDDTGKITGTLSAGIDITDQIISLNALRESERSKRVLLENLPGMAYRCKYDTDWTMEFVSKGCRELTGYEPESLVHNKDFSFNELVAPGYRDILRDEWARVLKLREMFRYEYEIIAADGEHKWVFETGQGIFGKDGNVEALEGIIIDITESKKRQLQIEYITDHDFMTGLYNRRYYESEKKRLDNEGCAPVSVLIADINGVKMVNDAFGHAEGDRIIIETAKILQNLCREGDRLARTGGDDFTIILPDTDRNMAYEILNKMKDTFTEINSTTTESKKQINLTIGFGTKDCKNESIEKAVKEAEDNLRTQKLFEKKSHYNSLLSSIMTTLYERSQETEEHSLRILKICKKIAERLGLSQSEVNELHLFSMLHDIGKIGIDNQILNKPDILTSEEWVIMKTHSEIGYRIVMSAPDLSSIADYILAHHERWDGKGYPYGLAEEKIPLLARILAVADAYDAMTENRVYRKALSKENALHEIEECAGTQFDPYIAQVFVELMSESENN